MRSFRRLARYMVAVAVIAAASAFDAAYGNHYILPCPPECRDLPNVPIGPGITGVWIDPAQSGHGFIIEILPGEPLRMAARWYVFEPLGGPTWIAADGVVSGGKAVLTGYRITGSGARFASNFDPANVQEEPWGTLTFSFKDCNHGSVEWLSSLPGYGSGAMDLVRLTLPAGLTCTDPQGGAARGTGGTQP